MDSSLHPILVLGRQTGSISYFTVDEVSRMLVLGENVEAISNLSDFVVFDSEETKKALRTACLDLEREVAS